MANDLFLSYAREDEAKAKEMGLILSRQGWSVFWDKLLSARESFPDVLEQELASVRAVVVLWSHDSVHSRWVHGEATRAIARNVFFPVLIDKIDIPLGFTTFNTIDLAAWQGELSHPAIQRFLQGLDKAIGQRKPVVSIAEAGSGPITDNHLALVHSSWRVPQRDAEFGGQKMYQIHVIVVGHPTSLERVVKVRYMLDPAYPDPVRESADRMKNFEIKELANGYSVIRAEIVIDKQIEHVRLSRFVNLTETGPRLEFEFMGQTTPPTTAPP